MDCCQDCYNKFMEEVEYERERNNDIIYIMSLNFDYDYDIAEYIYIKIRELKTEVKFLKWFYRNQFELEYRLKKVEIDGMILAEGYFRGDLRCRDTILQYIGF